MDFETARKMFQAVKRQDITSKITNIMNDPKFQKTVKDPRVQSAALSIAEKPTYQNAALNMSTSSTKNVLSTSTSSSLNIEEISRQFESRPIIQMASSSIFNPPNTTKSSLIYPSLPATDPFDFPPPLQTTSLNAKVNNSINHFSWNDGTSFTNPIFTISKYFIQ